MRRYESATTCAPPASRRRSAAPPRCPGRRRPALASQHDRRACCRTSRSPGTRHAQAAPAAHERDPRLQRQRGVPAGAEGVAGTPPPPIELLSYVANDPLRFAPGSEYRYSNSDNIVVGLMVEAVTGRHYQRELGPARLRPAGARPDQPAEGRNISSPAFRGYDVTEDPAEDTAPSWPPPAGGVGGVISSPRDLTRFVRGYVTGATTDEEIRKAQFNFIRAGPPTAGAGHQLRRAAIFRYQTNCGTVFGHTANTPATPTSSPRPQRRPLGHRTRSAPRSRRKPTRRASRTCATSSSSRSAPPPPAGDKVLLAALAFPSVDGA